MLRLSQNKDSRWKDIKIGKSKYTIGTNGCLIVSLCMILSKFYPERGFEHFYTPAEAVRDWKFTGVTGDPDPRYLVWSSINNSGMKFIWRKYNYMPDSFIEDPVTKETDLESNILKKYASSKDYGVVMQVINSKGNQHWVALEWKSLIGWVGNDPWNGAKRWMLPFPYKRIGGWALIKKHKI
jgi:hypothetical protein